MLKRIVFLHHQHVSTKCIYPGISGALVSTKAWALDTTRALALVSNRAWAWGLDTTRAWAMVSTRAWVAETRALV